MSLNIPTRETVKEYKRLRQSQQPVKVNSTSKKMDNYIVYGKEMKKKTLFLASLCSMLSVVGHLQLKENSLNKKVDKKIGMVYHLGVWSILALTIFDFNNNSKRMYLADKYDKRDLYRKHGINMVL